MDVTGVIAENLKDLRMQRNLSLGQLSALCDVSKVMLSQIEKGETNPTINTIWKIANGLKVPYSALLEKRVQETSVQHKEVIRVQADEGGHYRLYCYYPTTPCRNFELFQIELDAGCKHTTTGQAERSEEYVMVLSGELTFTIGGASHILGIDDAIQFDASADHSYFASGNEMLKAIIINHYPA